MYIRPNDRRLWILPLLPLLLSLVIFVPGCRKPAEEVSLIRLIDILDREGVVDSPILDYISNSKGLARDYPYLADLVDKYPLLDLGAGQNPLLLKKKLRIGSIEENALLAAPKSVFRFKVRVPRNSILEFVPGVYWGKDPGRKTGEKRAADFTVRLKHRNGEDLIFQEKLVLTPNRTVILKRKRVDLARYSGQEVNLEFSTRGQPGTLAFWFNPVIFRRQDQASNVILISLDTLGAAHLACYGYGRATSPNLDKLAADSVLFKNTFAASPWTLPSHVSLLTGLDVVTHQVSTARDRMDPGLATLADRLRLDGYVTSAFTGGGFVNGIYGQSKGFDSFRIVGRILSANGAKTLTDSVLPWLDGSQRKKFFLFLHTYQIHQPYFSPPPFNKMFLDADAALDHVNLGALRINHEQRFLPATDAQRRNYIGLYDAEIRYTDEALIGPLVGHLKKLGLYDRTMIIVTADHGEEFYEHKAWSHSHALYDETIKVPLLIKFPGSRNGGTTVDRFARLTDIMPTILEEMGIDYPRKEMDGRSLLELIQGKGRQGPERMFRSEMNGRIVRDHIPAKKAVNRGSFKVIVNNPYGSEDLSFFLTPPPPLQKLEVYDLAADPKELVNLALSRPDLARSLLKYLEENMKPARKKSVQSPAPVEDVREELKALGYIR